MLIAIDFDNTIARVEKYPTIIEPVPGAIDAVKWLYFRGHELILWTCREEQHLQDALAWIYENDIAKCFVEINQNTADLIALYNNNPRKIGAELYIDDKAIGCPTNSIGLVDWGSVVSMIISN